MIPAGVLNIVRVAVELVTNGSFDDPGSPWEGVGADPGRVSNGQAVLSGDDLSGLRQSLNVATQASATYRLTIGARDFAADGRVSVANGPITIIPAGSGPIVLDIVAGSAPTNRLVFSNYDAGEPATFDNVSLERVLP